jgi:hypothetical protein
LRHLSSRRYSALGKPLDPARTATLGDCRALKADGLAVIGQ